MKSLSKIREEVLKLPKETTPIDPGILDLVIVLQALNFPTQFSCEGHPERTGTMPYVDIYPDNSTIDFKKYTLKMQALKKSWIKKNIKIQTGLIKLLTNFYKNRKVPYQYQLSLHTKIDWCWFRLKSIGADQLQNLPLSKRKKELKLYQNEMQSFAKFLLKTL